MKKRENNKIVYVLLVAVVLLLAWVIYTFYQSIYFGADYQKALQSENPADICATPPGYTDEQWREHMSHHPDKYQKCLE